MPKMNAKWHATASKREKSAQNSSRVRQNAKNRCGMQKTAAKREKPLRNAKNQREMQKTNAKWDPTRL